MDTVHRPHESCDAQSLIVDLGVGEPPVLVDDISVLGVLGEGCKPKLAETRPEIFVDGVQPAINDGGLRFVDGAWGGEDGLGSGSAAGVGLGLGASQIGELEGNHVGALQFWGYALISGSADGSVRMWDSECSAPSYSNVAAVLTSWA